MTDDTHAESPRHVLIGTTDALSDDQREHRATVAAQTYLQIRSLFMLFPDARTEKLEADAYAYLVSIGEAV